MPEGRHGDRKRGFALAAVAATILLGFLLGSVSTGLPQGREPAGSCPVIPPTIALQGAQRIYVDRAGSIPDKAEIARQQEFIRPLRQLVSETSSRVDTRATDMTALDCANKLMSDWAGASALLGGRPNFSAVRDRARFAIGLNVVALKLQAAGRPASQDVRNWLRQLNAAVMRDFGRRPDVDNLYVWSGVNAATSALVSEDPEALTYTDRVWKDAIAQIDPQGRVASEMRRQSRATLYHNYYLAGLLLLRETRRALDRKPSPADDDAIRRLGDFVVRSFCDPSAMRTWSGGYDQVETPRQQLVIPLVFMPETIGNREKAGCVPQADGQIDTPVGGDMARLKEILAGKR